MAGGREAGRGRNRKEEGSHTCHFRHEGLKLGRPFNASSSEMKTYRVGRSRILGERVGSSLGG